MTNYTFNFPNGTLGYDYTLQGLSNQQNFPFANMILLFVWLIVFLGGFTIQNRRTGRADGSIWATLASVTTLVTSLILTIKSGYIEPWVLGLVVGVTIASGIWLFMSRGANEV